MSEAHAPGEVLIGDSGRPERLRLDRANRHGLVAGATGTGKTVTLQILAQGLSDAGTPVFAADVKGDLSGVAAPGEPGEKMLARARSMNMDAQAEANVQAAMFQQQQLAAAAAAEGAAARTAAEDTGEDDFDD